MRLPALFVLLAAGCYAVPEDLPGFEGVPVEQTNSCAPSRTAPVACVIDGDTLDINRCGDDTVGERIRLLGINAPEVASDEAPAECFGPQAEDALDDLLTGRDVRLEFDLECEDAFGRTLAWVFVEDEDEDEPINASLWLVENGLARIFDEFEFDDIRYASLLRNAEESARASDAGLWGACEE